MAAVVLNAANEVAVDAFLTGQLSFVGIAEVIEASLAAVIQTNVFTLPTVLATDSEARRVASAIIQQLEKRHG
jgi:1-deoxy-D-xylulose-5-phosphate reductoisomerase